MILDGVAASEAIDKSGEVLRIDGLDITDFVMGKAPLDWEHAAERQPGTFHEEDPSKRPGSQDIIGKVVYARKVRSADDCEDDRQRKYWDQVRLPFLYVRARLFDESGHAGAQGVAAMVRDAKTHNEPLLVGFSVGGGTLERNGSELVATVGRSLAVTVRPCNASCLADMVGELDGLQKHDRLAGWTVLQVEDPEVPADLLTKKEVLGAPEEPATPAAKLPRPTALTVQGKKVRQSTSDSTHFDSKKGILHTPRGSIKAYLPSHDGSETHFLNILNDPAVEKAHARAMEGWSKAHKLLREKRLPAEVAMHATLFSYMSPNTPVGSQELMYSHLVDAMKQHGTDPTQPGFEHTLADWKARGGTLPQHSQGHFAAGGPQHAGTHTAEGKPYKHMLANDKGKNVMRYQAMHGALVDLINRHGRDVRSASDEVMTHKINGELWDARRERAAAKGKADPGEYQGPRIGGLAPKTTRYTMGMVGGGNVLVPDTHFVRHFYGLDKTVDGDTIEHVKQQLWNPQNHHVLNEMDKWYAANHPAVKHMVDHPTWGKTFQHPEDAIFPAFWKHWMAIVPHERHLGRAGMGGYNELTTHAPYWEAIEPYMKAEGMSDLPMRTAQVHRRYVEQFGEVPAQMLFASHLLPRLIEEGERRQAMSQGTAMLADLHPKLDSAAHDLHTAAHDWPGAPRVMSVETQHGRKLGRIMELGGKIHHLEDYHGLLDRVIPEGPVDDRKVAQLHALQASPHLNIRPDLPALDKAEEPAQPAQEVPAAAAAPAAKPTSQVFRYRRAGMNQDHTLEIHGDTTYLDGKPVPPSVAKLMIANAKLGAASLRLMKADDAKPMDPDEATHHIRQAVLAGHLPEEVGHVWTRHIYGDNMVDGVGGKYAYKKFREKGRPGVYIGMDGTDFKALNDQHGHDAGDEGIHAYGKALREAMDEALGRGPDAGKLFRNPDVQDVYHSGGDEFVAYAPTHDHAIRFLAHARAKLDAIPPVGGSHKLTMAFGLGTSPEHADRALYHAKAQKHSPTGERRWPVGQVPHLGHSLVPGKEGPIALHSEAPPVHPDAAALTAPKPAA